MEFATGAASGVVSKIGESLAEATIKQGRYLCCFNSIVEDLQEEAATLTAAKDDMMVKVEKAKQETKIIYKEVEKWQSDASKILEEVEGLRKEIEEKKSCLSGWCPNWGCRYWLGRKATKKTINMKRVVGNGKFETIGHPAPLPDDAEFLAPKDFEFFKSSKLAFEQIIEALKHNQINLVGLYGMGGTGKTTLAKAVGEKVKGEMFDKVIMAVISQTPNFEGIQAHLAQSLDLKLEEKTKEDRAKRLYKRFTETEDKILLILDDVWENFDLKDLKSEIGISFDSDSKCKVLLTTRQERVCITMDCKQSIQLKVLEEKEGLALLKRHARIVDDDSELNAVASQVARQCGGLPLALVAIGSALKEQEIDDWKVMLGKLKRAELEDIPNSIVAGEKGIYASLRVSYDYLQGKKAKQCFLWCSLFPEDHAIRMEELFCYAMGLGWCRADLIEDSRRELLSTVRYLKASGLLIDAGEEYVKMHDMVRDVALWIASNGENVFKSKVGMGQIEWSKEEDWERYTAISLMANKIEELSIGLVCPKLEILILGGESFSKNLKVSDECFKEMKGLNVLSLTHVDLSLKSLQFLINLKTLRLRYCDTRDISYLKKLNRLEILLFDNPSFDELPRELSELCELRLFYLDRSVRIPSNVLRRCSKLEELYTLDRFRYGADEETCMASIFEVISLSRLSTLHLNIHATCLPKGLAFPKLQGYVICVNTNSQMISYKRALAISNIEAGSLIAFKALYETLEYLRLENVRGCQNLLPSIDQGGFNELKEADISACDMLQEVFQLEGLCHAGKQVLPRLAKLALARLPVLRHIWKGPIHQVNLQSLTHLCVDSCRILEHIFPISIARDLVQLEELTIRNAPRLKQVFYLDHAREEIAAETDGKDIELPKLRILRLDGLQSLTSFLPENYHSKWPMLEELHISECSSLTTSFISEVKMEDLKEKLRVLEIECCHNQLYDELTLSCLRYGFKNLEELIINNCRIKVVFHLEGFQTVIDRERKEILSLPSLKKLRLISLKELEDLVKNPKDILSLQSLTHLFVSNCPKLRHDFLPTLARNLRLLEELSIEKFEEIENVIEDNEEDRPQPLFFPKLRAINVKECAKLKYLFPISITQQLQQLESIEVEACDQLEKVFEHKDGADIMNDKEILLLQLKHLSLKKLPNLINFGLVGYHHILKLNSLSMSDCNRICAGYLYIYHGPIVVICGLQRELRSLEAAKGFCNLCLIKCYNLKHIFASNLAQDLLQLKELYIISCEELEQIIVEDEINIQTPFFPNLSKIDVRGCNKLKHLFPVNIAAGLQQLKSINVQDCDQLQKVFGHENGADDTNDKEIELPQLKELSLSGLPSLTDFGPVDYQFILKLNSLYMSDCNRICAGYLDIYHGPIVVICGLQRELRSVAAAKGFCNLCLIKCYNLKHIFSSNLAQDLLQLKELYIISCEGLEQIIVEDEINIQTPFFPNLSKIDVRGCNKLKHLFPVNIAAGLQQLESINVHDCDQLQKVFGHKNGAGDTNDKEIVLPQLKKLSLNGLPSLTDFETVDYQFILKLQVLKIKCCPKLRHIFSCNHARNLLPLEELSIEGCDEMEYVIVEDKDAADVMNDKEIILPQLNALSLIELPSLTNFCPMGYHFILKLERSLKIFGCHQMCASSMYCQGPVIVIYGLQRELRSLEVENLLGPQNPFALCIVKSHSLKHIFSSTLAQDLLQLKELYIISCEELEQIIVEDEKNHIQTPFFPNLCRIDVSGCNKLEHLFPVNIAAGLQQLESIDVQGCDQLQKVFGHKNGADDTNDKKIVLPQLKELSLNGLPNLTDFGPVDYQFILKLDSLDIDGCDQMCAGYLYCKGPVNVFFGLQRELRSLEEGQGLCIIKSYNLEFIFSSNLARDLLQLEDLYIINCEELEQIIVEDGEDDHIQTLFFPNLRTIDIRGCNKLKYVFPITMVRGLQKLDWISVEECDQLEEVFFDGDNIIDDKEVLFSPHGTLQLEKLPRLINFCSPGYHCIFPSLRSLRVKDCPNIATRFSRGEGGSVHAECKPPNEGSNDDDHPPMDIGCFTPPDLEKQLPPFMEKMEIISDRIERMQLVHEVDIETVPSQPEGGKMKPGGQSFEAAAPIETFKAGPSNVSAVEPPMASLLRKEDEIPPRYRAESEIQTEDQWSRDPKSDFPISIKRTALKIFKCMIGLTVGRIGVHGIGGIGKTTVLKALSSYRHTVNIFDLIILVSVSRSWNIRKIQNEVSRQLSLCREDSESDPQVAEKLFQALSGKKFLLLVDDVWEPIDLQAVGIPDPNSENGCKIIMASRRSDILHALHAVPVIEVTTLSREEAWELFCDKVGGIVDSPDIHPFAESIVEGCGGLPLLIIVTGRALWEENNISAWEDASRKFSQPTTGVDHFKNLIQKLKFSFDQLKDQETKTCFLHCCLFSEGQVIDISEFIEYCIQEGLIAGSRADARERVYDIVCVLIRNSLLQLTESRSSFKIHDLIRDLSLGILSVVEGSQYLLRSYSRLIEVSSPGNSLSSRSMRSPEGSGLLVPGSHRFILRAGAGLTEPPSEEEWKQARMIFLMDNELCTLPARPSCPELSILFLQRNHRLRVIPMSFFDLMTSLKVLNLSKTRIKSLPKTLFKLENLQILILHDCERLAVLPSEVGSLACLEVLDLEGTQITELPLEIGNLTSLRHLEVSFYGSINNSEYVKLPYELISSGIISRLQSLETLGITVYPGDQRWYKDVKHVMNEVSKLTKLRSLCFHFPEAELLELFLQTSRAWNSQRLTAFKFVVGHDVKRITSRVPESVELDYIQQSRCLRFVNGENIPDAVLRTLACSTALYLDHHTEIRSLTKSNSGVSYINYINGLNFCIVSECCKMETVVNSSELAVAVLPDLENLSIHHLWNLKCIWEGIFPKGSFAGLRILTVQSCPKLKYIFSGSVVQFFSKLVELTVEDCPAVEEIIHEGEIIDSRCSTTLPSLKRLTLHHLPGLVNIWRSAWPSLEQISLYDCPNLKDISIDSTIKYGDLKIKAEKSWWDALEWENSELRMHLQDRFTAICEDDL